MTIGVVMNEGQFQNYSDWDIAKGDFKSTEEDFTLRHEEAMRHLRRRKAITRVALYVMVACYAVLIMYLISKF